VRRLTGQGTPMRRAAALDSGWTLLVFSFCSVELGEGGMTGEDNKMEEDWVSRDGGGKRASRHCSTSR